MEITGRVTADATVTTTATGKNVVNFSIAINDSYRKKGNSEPTEIVTYIDCSYWLNERVAQILRKGALVQLFGRIGLSVYTNSEGNAAGRLTFHTNDLKMLVFAKRAEAVERAEIDLTAQAPAKNNVVGENDDLPF